jgi:hypothetical protein
MKNLAPELKMSAPTTRRIIQISAVPESESHSLMVFALTEDGTLYNRYFSITKEQWGEWEMLSPIPATTKDGPPWP